MSLIASQSSVFLRGMPHFIPWLLVMCKGAIFLIGSFDVLVSWYISDDSFLFRCSEVDFMVGEMRRRTSVWRLPIIMITRFRDNMVQFSNTSFHQLMLTNDFTILDCNSSNVTSIVIFWMITSSSNYHDHNLNVSETADTKSK